MVEKTILRSVLILDDFVRAWVLMLMMGIIHWKYLAVPAIGYWTALVIVIAVDQLHKVAPQDWRD